MSRKDEYREFQTLKAPNRPDVSGRFGANEIEGDNYIRGGDNYPSTYANEAAVFAQVIIVNNNVLMIAPSHTLPVFAVILLEITVEIARIGTIGMRTIYPSAISFCHNTPVVVNVPY